MDRQVTNTLIRSSIFYLLTTVIVAAILVGCAAQKEEISALPEDQSDTLMIDEGEQEPELELGHVTEVAEQSNQLTSGNFDNGLGNYSPHGDRIIFQSNRDSKWQIYEFNLNDKSETRVIASEANDENPVWMTDGNSLIFVSDRNSRELEWERDIYLFDATSSEIMPLTETSADDWFPVPIDEVSFIFLTEREANQELDVYYKQNAMYMGFIDGTEAIKIAGIDVDPSAPLSWKENKFIIRTPEGGLAIWSYDDGSIDKLTPSRLKCGTSTINRDRDWIVFCAREQEKFSLYLLDLNTKMLQLLETPGDDIRYPQFSPDGTTLLYTAKTEGYFQIFTLDLEP